MAIITFKSKACGEIYMFSQTAEKIFQVIGKKLTEKGAIPQEDLGACIEAIKKEMEREKEIIQAYKEMEEEKFRRGDVDKDEDKEKEQPKVFFSQRAYPFLEMLEFSKKEDVPVFWGVP